MDDQNVIDKLVDECIGELVNDDVTKGAESLQELARYWAEAGLSLKSFLDMRIFIINQAKEKTDAAFIDEKLQLAESRLREERAGSPIIITH